MPVASSAIVEDAPQRDGRRRITERHTDTVGNTYDVVYLADAGVSTAPPLAAHAAQVAANLIDAEFGRVVVWVQAGNSIQTFPYSEMTMAQAARRLCRLLANAADPRPFRAYAAVVAGTAQATVAALLGITSAQAAQIKTWAQAVVDSLDSQDSSKATAASAITAAGG